VIGGTFQVVNSEDHDDSVTMVMIKCLDLEKKEEKNKKLKAKVNS
jgi:hypothetical protein